MYSHIRRRGPRAGVAAAVLGVALLAAAASIAPPATAATLATSNPAARYYVDCSASKNGSGTSSAPWNSLGHVNAHGTFAPSEQILLKRGTTCSGRLHPIGSGKKNAPIVVGAYGTSKSLPTIKGGGTANGTGVVQLDNQAWWTIQDLHITNRSSARETKNYRAGILLNDTQGGRLDGVTVQRVKIDSLTSNLSFSGGDAREWGGIAVHTVKSKTSGYDNLNIFNNTISKVGRTGIVVANHGFPKTSDRNLRISGNRITGSRGDGIVLRGSTNGRLDHNRVANAASLWPCAQCGAITPYTANAGIWPALSRNITIEYNEVYGTHRLGGDGEGIDVDMDAVGTVLQYNYVHDNEGGGILFCGSGNTTARFNILQNNKGGAFVFIGSIPATNTKIYNNTVYASASTNARIVHTQGVQGGRGISFFNNLIYNLTDTGYYVWPAKYTSRTNIFVGVHGIGEPRGYAEEFADPGLVNPGSGRNGFASLAGYQRATPADDTPGTAIPKSVTKDILGRTIDPNRPPRGAAG